MRAALLLAGVLATAAPASGAVAPGRVTFPFSPEKTVVFDNPELGAPSTGVPLPGGGAVLAGVDRGRGVVLVQLRADGTLDPGFGNSGISNVTAPYDPRLMGALPYQLLRRPDGRLLLVYEAPWVPPYEEPPDLLGAGVTADGRLDMSYGD